MRTPVPTEEGEPNRGTESATPTIPTTSLENPGLSPVENRVETRPGLFASPKPAHEPELDDAELDDAELDDAGDAETSPAQDAPPSVDAETPPPPVPESNKPARRPRRASLVFGLGAGGLLAILSSAAGGVGDNPDRFTGLCAALASQHALSASPEDITWLTEHGTTLDAVSSSSRALVRATALDGEAGEPADIYLVQARLSPEGVLLEVGDVFNLSKTSQADESKPDLVDGRATFISRSLVPGAPTTINILDFSGQQAPPEGWSRLERAQQALTNYQDTGQLRGIEQQVFVIDSVDAVDVSFRDGTMIVSTGDRQAEVPLSDPTALLPAWVRVDDFDMARPGSLVTWSVDRVRSMPWFGDDNMQRLKEVAFGAKDLIERNIEKATGDTGEEGIAEDLGLGADELSAPTKTLVVDPELGWPPEPLEPWVTPSLPGEGEWNAKNEEPFHRTNPGLPAPFVTTFIRTDRGRQATRVYVATWDPRQIELHMMAGRVEPKGATGKAGSGLIPRTPEVMNRVVGALNSGFQALHGEYGMMAEGIVYLPPKPYAATVMKLDDGSTGFGTWNVEPAVPDVVRSFRQNMTVMVENEKFNPYGRTWWGGAVPGAEDQTHTVRTGICLTREHFVSYFYGADLSPNALAQAMIQARCIYGLALDMNAGHSGLEFYKAVPEAEFEPLGRPLRSQMEYEGDVPYMEGWKFRRQSIIKGMGLMNPPRYIKREARDFFYLTLRHLLPGDPVEPLVTPAQENEGAWEVKGLPQHGFPYVMARTEIRLNKELSAHMLKLDPRALTSVDPGGVQKVSGVDIGALSVVVDPGPYPSGDEPPLSIWHQDRNFVLSSAPPSPTAVRFATNTAFEGAARAAVGIGDESGMLFYAQLDLPADAEAPADGRSQLKKLMAHVGCSDQILLEEPLDFALGGDTDLSGKAKYAPVGSDVAKLFRRASPGGKRLFEDTPVVPLKTWYPLQQHRVRYFKKPKVEKQDAEEDGS